MRYVLDSSVAVKWELPEAGSDRALRLRDGTRLGTHELAAPDVFPAECVHAITRAERQGRVTPAEGDQAVAAILSELPALHPSVALPPRAYAIASAARIGVYDCLYVALAEREGCELVTAVAKLLTNLKARVPFITDLVML
jgi:predicted nucleic acid-binding protein